MEQQYDNTNRGSLFKNDKEGNEARPDYKGMSNIEGVEYNVSVWLKTSKGGMKYMAMVYEKKKPGGGTAGQVSRKKAEPVAEDDIPF
jgi:hypothetical protein